MNEVFILGAGFSKAISRWMPLTRDLSKEVTKSYAGSLPPEIQSMVEEDFEKALTFLAQQKPWLSEAQNLRHRALYLDLTQVIRGLFRLKNRDPSIFGTNSVPEWLQFLICYWHENRCSVISLNYDTLIERFASMLCCWKKTLKIPTGTLYPVPLTPAAQRSAGVIGSDPIETFRLFKLHGSINWFYSGASDFFGEDIYYVPCFGGVDSAFDVFPDGKDREKMHQSYLSDKVPLIIPPALDKSAFFQHESLRSLWFQAGEAIKRADKIICMGYSLPGSDLTMAQFLKSCAPVKHIPFEVINFEPNRADHFTSVLGEKSYGFIQELDGAMCIPRFVVQKLVTDNEDRRHIINMTSWGNESDSDDVMPT